MQDEIDNGAEKEKKTHLENHIYYSGGGNNITFFTMFARNRAIGRSFVESATSALKVALLGGYEASPSGCPGAMFTPSQAAKALPHSQSTGIYRDGNIDEDKWAELLKYADQDKSIITKPQFYAFLNACRMQDTRPDPWGLDRRASDGEWKTYWERFAYTNPQGERYVPIQKLRQFFENTAIPGKEVEEELQRGMRAPG